MIFELWHAKGVLTLYRADGAHEIKLEKQRLDSVSGGNISDLGGYYNELKYFTDCLKNGEKPAKAGLADAARSVEFVRAEMK